MIATYRLSERLASFEFFIWLVMVKAAGATKIVVDVSNPKTAKVGGIDSFTRRVYSIIEPGPALAGLPCRFGTDRSRVDASATEFVPWLKAGNRFARLETVKPPVPCNYTITLRKNFGAKARDSNEDAWRRFGEEIGAIVIEDYSVKPIHLHDRVAMYAGAKMNFGVCNGPAYLISLTPYPVMQFINSSARHNVSRLEAQPDQKRQLWMLPNQHLVWQDDTLDNLRRAFEKIKC